LLCLRFTIQISKALQPILWVVKQLLVASAKQE